jgi:Cu-Zn family superoxide dismutase
MRAILCGVLFLSAAGAALAQSHSATKPVTVDIKNAQGQSVGTATLSSAEKGVKITLGIKNLPPGEHSLHIHEFAKCEPPDFKSAGTHFGGAHAGHEGMTPAGDIPDFALIVAADGTAHASTVAPNVTLGDDASSVFSNGGTPIVIHAVSSGGAAPARIACGNRNDTEDYLSGRSVTGFSPAPGSFLFAPPADSPATSASTPS